MPLLVMKFGGTSVADLPRIANAAAKVEAEVARGYDVIVIVSAMSGKTNELVGWVESTSNLYDAREYDAVVASGENVTAGLMALRLQEMGIPARSWQGWQVPISTTSAHGSARFVSIPRDNIDRKFAEGMKVAVVAGFQGVSPEGRITTLGRGGSDTSAVALAAALGADECQIYTDVDGVYTTDPRIVPEARRLQTVTFEEMLEMAGAGSKVLQIRSVEFAGKYKVPTRVLSSLTDPKLPVDEEARSGTLITFEEDPHMAMEKAVVSGVAAQKDEAKITVHGVPDRPGIAYAILGPIADAGINVDVIVQNVSHDGMTDLSFTIARGDMPRAMRMLKDQVRPAIKCREVTGDERMAKVSIVGLAMRSHAGIAAKMFRTLAEEGINIEMISTSEIKISVVIDEKHADVAVRALHRAFELDQQ